MFEVMENVTENLSRCDMESHFLLCDHFGTQQIYEVIYLSVICLIGTMGNFIVVFSIIHGKKIHNHGNLFIINLAVADFIVCGIFVPTVIANVIKARNVLSRLACQIFGFLLTVTALASISNLMLIAINRYWAVVHMTSYSKYFSNKRIFILVICVWIWSLFLSSPALFGWSDVVFDYRVMVCVWNDKASLSYNIVLMVLTHFSPLIIITFCYWSLFRSVRKRRKMLHSTPDGQNKSKSVKREMHLLRTLATSVAIFVLCWAPYVYGTLTYAEIHHQVKKIFGWLGLTNSAVNFIIYGLLNPNYRRGYKNSFAYLFCCNKSKRKCTDNFEENAMNNASLQEIQLHAIHNKHRIQLTTTVLPSSTSSLQ